MNTQDYPEHTAPEPPAGMKWEYRGTGWGPTRETTYYYIGDEAPSKVISGTPFGIPYTYYFESVPFVDEQETSAEEEDVLEEALRLTSGDRQNQYGPPDQDFTRTAALWSALFGHKLNAPFEARDVAMAMICLKLSRETHQRKRDNAVDGAGYFRCLHICNEAKTHED